jgi:hypothetical protein
VFEGVQGGIYSSISIDDTAITDGTCTPRLLPCIWYQNVKHLTPGDVILTLESLALKLIDGIVSWDLYFPI